MSFIFVSGWVYFFDYSIYYYSIYYIFVLTMTLFWDFQFKLFLSSFCVNLYGVSALALFKVLKGTGSQSAGRDYFSEKVALFCIYLEASRGVKIWRGITTFILHFNWF